MHKNHTVFCLMNNIYTYNHLYLATLKQNFLTLKVLVMTIDAQREGMGDVGSARYEPALLPHMPDHKGFKLQ